MQESENASQPVDPTARRGQAGSADGAHTPQADPKTLRKATLAGFAGTVVEWFDFAVYGFMAPIIAQTFFRFDDPVVPLLQTFAVFAIAFALRPLGGAFFGMLGDKIGRKRVLIEYLAFWEPPDIEVRSRCYCR